MPDEQWLLIDCCNACHRMFHALPPMNGPDKRRTEVVFGFLREVRKWERDFAPCRLFFFWDSGVPKRKAIYPEYKANREESRMKRAGTEKDDKHLQAQMYELCYRVLPRLGYNNVYHEEGYEADDLIVVFSRNHVPQFPPTRHVIVSSDKDFYQSLFISSIRQYDPRTESMVLGKDMALTKHEWLVKKAVMGDATDNIPGVPGFGPIKAEKYAIGGYPSGSPESDRVKAHKEVVQRNMKLITLPIDWAVRMEVMADTVRQSKWDKALAEFGIRRLA